MKTDFLIALSVVTASPITFTAAWIVYRLDGKPPLDFFYWTGRQWWAGYACAITLACLFSLFLDWVLPP